MGDKCNYDFAIDYADSNIELLIEFDPKNRHVDDSCTMNYDGLGEQMPFIDDTINQSHLPRAE